MSKFIDETGNRFSKLLVLKRVENAGNGHTQWLCKCDCGNKCVVTASNLRRGRQVSCGCYGKSVNAKNNVPTELKQSRIYTIWKDMLYRCNCEKSNRYSRYGLRGIKVCDEWVDNFNAFYEWAMSNGYDDTLSIDRIDTNGNYEPSNCRWASRKTQARNRSTNRLLTYKGVTKCLAEWCEIYNLKQQTISQRIKYGWDDTEEILFGRMKGEINNG